MNQDRKPPIGTDAIHFDGSEDSAVVVIQFIEAGEEGARVGFCVDEDPSRSYIDVPTPGGITRATAGDWITRGLKGGFLVNQP